MAFCYRDRCTIERERRKGRLKNPRTDCGGAVAKCAVCEKPPHEGATCKYAFWFLPPGQGPDIDAVIKRYERNIIRHAFGVEFE